MKFGETKKMALSGILAGVAVVIMCMGGMIPVATYVCPMLCSIVAFVVLLFCGKRLAWVWYCAVAILSLIMGPDKEAAAVFLVLGYYPLVKPYFDRSRFRWLWKLLLFNGSVAALYCVLLRLFGMTEVSTEFEGFGYFGLAVMLLLGNVVFFLLDRVLTMMLIKVQKKVTKHG